MPRIAGKGRGLLRGPVCGPRPETRRSLPPIERPDAGERLDEPSARASKPNGLGAGADLETTLAELVKTMQAQNARLEAVEARRGLIRRPVARKAA